MIRKIARPMLASVYIADGADTLLNTQDHVESTENVLKRVRTVLPRRYARQVPKDAELVARSLGGAKAGAGSLLAFGKLPRVSAAVLAATAVPTILGRHAFWETQDREERRARRSGFVTNIALLGGLFITSADTAGKPGLKWRATKAAETANKKVHSALPMKSETEKVTDNVTDTARNWAGTTADKATEYATRAQDYVNENKDDWFGTARHWVDEAADKATEYATRAQGYVNENKGDWLSAAQNSTATARKGVVKAATKAQTQADKALATADAKSGRSAKKARKTADKLQDRADKALVKAKKKVGKELDK
ncbi:DoxX family membrane protein [Corynebacterium halotolerans]|nr:DoxX family membrane protein [Corynebacterium halotolerans]